MSQSEEIKNQLDIVDLIREYIQVKAVGANFQALCPFHREKTPSFIISPEKQIWHCFGCGKGGDVFSFVMAMEGLDFKEALQLLAPKAGVTLNQQFSREHSRRKRLLALMKLAADYYARLLNQDKAGEACREYLLKRALNRESLSLWLIGYSRQAWDDIIKYLRSQSVAGRNFSDEEIFSAGLSIRKEGTNNYYDRFRGRIMFPIRDQGGQVVAFTARLDPSQEKEAKQGKYINSPQTELYDKSKVLFGLDQAKLAIKEQDWAIFVEGQTDVIIGHQFGFKNMVASSGTALSREQLNLIKRYSNKIAFAFDMDKAGQLAADRGIEEAMKLDMRIKVIILPVGYKDPADCLEKNPDAFREALKSSLPMMEYYFNKTIADRDLNNLEEKRLVSDTLLKMIVKLASNLDQDYWFKRLSEVIDVPEQILRETATDLTKEKKYPNINQEIETAVKPLSLSREEKLIELFLSLLLKFPQLIPQATGQLEPESLVEPNWQSFYQNLIIYYNKFNSLDYQEFRLYLKNQSVDNVALLDRLTLLGERDYYNYNLDSARLEMLASINQFKKIIYQKEIKVLEKKINLAEAEGRQADLNSLMTELKNISDNLNSLS